MYVLVCVCVCVCVCVGGGGVERRGIISDHHFKVYGDTL